MNNPIINPWWIYFISILSDLDSLLETIIFILVISVVGFGLFCIFEFDDDTDIKNCLSLIKKGILIFLITVFLSVLVPSEKVMYTMFVSSYVTKENVEMTGDAIKNAVDYIFEKVDELGEDD